MNTEHDRYPVHPSWVRIGLLVLAVPSLGNGLWAFLPRVFYDDFPLPGRYWVSTLGPYNEHLVRDYGAMNLALGLLLVFAAVVLERKLAQAALVAWLSSTRCRSSCSASCRGPPFLAGRQPGAVRHPGVPGLAPAGPARPYVRRKRSPGRSRG